jgi:hypothetical protein
LANKETTVRLIKKHVAEVKEQMELPESNPAMVIYDAFRRHSGAKVQKLLADNYLLTVRVPNNSTDRLQPLDLSTNKAVKDKLRQSFTDWYASQVRLQIEARKNLPEV